MNIAFKNDQLSKHQVTQEECEEVFQSNLTVDFPMSESKRGNPRLMFIGFTTAGRCLEIGVEFLSEESWLVFHANDITKQYAKLLSDT